VTTNPCPLCGVATNAATCSTCVQGLAGVDGRTLASPRVAAAAALWLAVRPGLAFPVLADLLATIAAETDTQPFSQTGLAGPVRDPFGWLDLDALRPIVTDAVRQFAADRRAADEAHRDELAARLAQPSDAWAVTR
jgi:hypothetical protein